MHTIPPSVLEEMLEMREMGWAPDWNFSFFDVLSERVLGNLSEMFEQPGFECRVDHVCGGDWFKEVASFEEALAELACRGTSGHLHFALVRDGQVIFEPSSWVTYDEERANIELVFFEHRLDLLNRPELWHRMVEYACHAARVAGARGVLIHDGSAWDADMGSMIDGDDPEHPDRAIWVDR
jgi:hypothetical protein